MPQPPPFSLGIFLGFVLIVVASLLMFLGLVRRWTTQRQWVSLSQWTRQRGVWFESAGQLPEILSPLAQSHGARALLHLSDARHTFLQLETNPEPGRTHANRWHILMRSVAAQRSGTAGLRPLSAPASLLDLLLLSPFPSLSVGHRFAVLATSSTAARALANSSSRALIPADLGLIVAPGAILIDFTSRPFDPIELDRMIALADQLAAI